MSDFVVTRIRTQADLDAALAIRLRVFVEEQHVPLEEEVDRYDVDPAGNNAAVHVLGRLDGVAIATGRLLLDLEGELPHISRVAVLIELRRHGYGATATAPRLRRHGYGAALMAPLHEEARLRGAPGVTLAAQLHAVPFYERLGYIARGPVFLDAGIEHRDMDLRFEA